MKNKLLLILLILPIISFPVSTFAQENLEWVTNYGGNSGYWFESGRKITNDKQGNLYVTGEFADTIKVDGHEVISNGGKEIFLTKLNPFGKVLWIKNFGSSHSDWTGDISVDENSDVYLTGTFRDTLIIGDSVYHSKDWYDIFIVKLSTDGELIWSKAFIGKGGNSPHAITNDTNGNIYITGQYGEDLFFDNFKLEGPTAQSDLFVVKLNPKGIVTWAKSTKSNANNFGNSIVSDQKGSLYLTGSMWDSVYFDNQLLVSTGMAQTYLAKIEASSGKFIWAVGGGGLNQGWNTGNSLTLDTKNNIILTGWYRGQICFGDSAISNRIDNYLPDNMFLAKFDTTGKLLWLKSTESNSYSDVYGVTSNTKNEIFLTGEFKGTLKIEDSIYHSEVQRSFDICILKFNENGKFQWLKSFGGNHAYNDSGQAILSYNDDIYCTGMVSTKGKFEEKYIDCKGVSDIFVLKLANPNKKIIQYQNLDEEVSVYPNPSSDSFKIRFDHPRQALYQIKLCDKLGNELYFKTVFDSDLVTIDLQNVTSGMYIIQIIDLENYRTTTKKIIKRN